jgi:hypothetical protein
MAVDDFLDGLRKWKKTLGLKDSIENTLSPTFEVGAEYLGKSFTNAGKAFCSTQTYKSVLDDTGKTLLVCNETGEAFFGDIIPDLPELEKSKPNEKNKAADTEDHINKLLRSYNSSRYKRF